MMKNENALASPLWDIMGHYFTTDALAVAATLSNIDL